MNEDLLILKIFFVSLDVGWSQNLKDLMILSSLCERRWGWEKKLSINF